jgi:4'-phosphopantetheinyl transferase EntD
VVSGSLSHSASQSALLVGLFPEGVAVACGDPAVGTPVRPAEAELVARAVAKRRLEFARGRACARAALALLGGPSVDILMGRDREPLWPNGFVGSLTHTDGFCAGAVARRDRFAGLGLDAEPDTPLEPTVAEQVASREECERAAARAGHDPARAAHLVFSAKEAFYKCQFPLTRSFLGFDAVRIEVDENALSCVLLEAAGPFRPGTTFRGRWRRKGGLILTAFWLATDQNVEAPPVNGG